MQIVTKTNNNNNNKNDWLNDRSRCQTWSV